MTEVALLPGELPHLLLRAACTAGQTAGELLSEIQLKVAIRRAAQEQYGRHVANRLCLAILADRRTPIGEGQLTSEHSTRGRDQARGKKAGTTSSTRKWSRCSCSMASGSS